jgi:hypothetical protein
MRRDEMASRPSGPGCADELARAFLHARLPPRPLPREQRRRCREPPAHLESYPAGLGELPSSALTPRSKVRLLRAGLARVVSEDGVLVLHHSAHNGRGYHEAQLPALESEAPRNPRPWVLVQCLDPTHGEIFL